MKVNFDLRNIPSYIKDLDKDFYGNIVIIIEADIVMVIATGNSSEVPVGTDQRLAFDETVSTFDYTTCVGPYIYTNLY